LTREKEASRVVEVGGVFDKQDVHAERKEAGIIDLSRFVEPKGTIAGVVGTRGAKRLTGL